MKRLAASLAAVAALIVAVVVFRADEPSGGGRAGEPDERAPGARAPDAPPPVPPDRAAEAIVVAPQAPVGPSTRPFGAVDAFQVTVEVIDPEGRPVEGARLFTSVDVAAQGAVTDGTGRATLSLAGARGGLVEVDVAKDGFRVARVRTFAGLDHVTVRLERGAVVTGRVVDPLERPVSGATVRIASLAAPLGLQDRLARTATSARDGGFVVAGLAPGDVRVEVRAEGYALLVREFEPGAGDDPLLLRLESERRVEVVVLEASGEPVPGARVTAHVTLEGVLPRLELEVRQTDADGRTVVQGLPAAAVAVDLAARAPQRFPGEVQLYGELLLRPRAEIVLGAPAATLEGVVRDPEGNPLPGRILARHWVEGAASFADGAAAEVGEDGRFRFDVYPADLRTLLQHHWAPPGGGARSGPLWTSDEIVLRPGEVRNVEATTDPVTRVRVECRSRDGEPVPDLLVAAVPPHLADDPSRTPTDFGAEGVSGRDGVVDLLLPSGALLFRAARDGRPLGQAVHTVTGPEQQVVLSVDDESRMRGRVIDDAGVPLSGRAVWLTDDAGATLGTTVTDAAGRFSFRGGLPGRGRLLVEGALGEPNGVERPCDPIDGAPLTIVMGRGAVSGLLVDRGTRTSLAGRVFLRKPYANGTIGAECWTLGVEADGRFLLAGTSPGAWRIHAHVPGYVPLERDVTVEGGVESTCELELTPGAYVRVRGLDGFPAGTPFTLVVRDPGAGVVERFEGGVAGSETPVFGPLPGGAHVLELQIGGRVHSRAIELRPGERHDVVFADFMEEER